MEKLPRELRTKLNKLHNLNAQSKELTNEISQLIASYGVDIEYLTGMKSDGMSTEALTTIYYGEGSADENISEIEDVFLYHVNKIST